MHACASHMLVESSAGKYGTNWKARKAAAANALSLPSMFLTPLFLPRYFLPRNRQEGARVCVEKARQKATFLTFNLALYKCLPSRTLPVYGDNRALTKVTVYGTPLPSFVRAYVRTCVSAQFLSLSLSLFQSPSQRHLRARFLFLSLFLPPSLLPSLFCAPARGDTPGCASATLANERTNGRMTVFVDIVTSVKS